MREIADRVSRLEMELAAARTALSEAVAARLAAAEAQAATLKEEYEALRSEYTLINEELSLRSTELLQVKAEKETAEAAAAAASAEVSGLRSEVERLRLLPAGSRVTEASAASPAPAAVSAAVFASPLAQAGRPHEAASTGGTSASVESGASFESSSFPAMDGAIFFQQDGSLAAVPCPSPDDIIELRVSINAIRISCDSTGIPHKCSAYICGVRHNGSKEVYVALHQIDSDRSTVYRPSRQPVDHGDYEKVMDSAVAFADITGFIVNMVYLGGSAEDRAEAIRQIPVFGKR